jgi:hypothetical protein
MDFDKPCDFFTKENSHENSKQRLLDQNDQLSVICRFIQYMKQEAIRKNSFTSILTLLKTKNIETTMGHYRSIQQYLKGNLVS